MIAELNAAFQSLNVLNNWVQAHRTLRNFNELAAAVYEVSSKLLAVQSVALEAQEKQATFAERIRELEKEIVELKNWDREKERYQLTQISGGLLAYSLKPGMEDGEPPHNLCANCYHKGEKSILQYESALSKMYRCPRCQHVHVIDI